MLATILLAATVAVPALDVRVDAAQVGAAPDRGGVEPRSRKGSRCSPPRAGWPLWSEELLEATGAERR